MFDIRFLTNILSSANINIPETFLKEEIVRISTEASTERIVEIPLILRTIPAKKNKILDIGCRYSLLSIHLASLGHEVFGIDIHEYKRKHPNFKFVKADILNAPFKNNFFDIVISLSTLEHIGLTRYGDDENSSGDKKTVQAAKKILKVGGDLIVTLPFGKKMDTKWYRVYDEERAMELVRGFKVIESLPFIEKNGHWFPSTMKEALKVDSSKQAGAVLFLKVRKR